MGNASFQFKKFLVRQEHCAMKVSTDACLFGSLIETAKAQRILDIGSGTGVLSLMLAQRSPAKIDAVEVDWATAQKCRENFKGSPWPQRLTCYQDNIHAFGTSHKGPYDLIICNPPFFANHLPATDKKQQTARHARGLTHADLLQSASKLLNPVNGAFWLMLPPKEAEKVNLQAAFHGLHPQKNVEIKTKPNKQVRLVILAFSSNRVVHFQQEHLTIYNYRGDYSKAFEELLQPYYLYL